MSFFEELKRRNVIKVAIAYIVVGWLVAQVAEFATENFGAPEWVLKIFVVFLLLGLPIVLLFAWAFEMTPEGIKREKDVDRSQSIAGHTGQKLNHLIIGVLTLAVAYLLIDKIVLQKNVEPAASSSVSTQQIESPGEQTDLAEAEPGTQSIAVLPFVNMSADADNEYFSDGISEELLNVLAKVSSLRVASRTSAFAYKGKELPVGEIARQLQVSNVLEGSVRKAGNRVRITAQLIDGGTDKHLWSETYERELDDIFQIQEEISNAIVDALKVALNVEEQQAITLAQHPTKNAEAYELYLQGRYLWRKRKEENIRSAIDLFEQAIKLDPEFAVAYEALAAAHGSLSSWSNVTSRESMATAVPYAERALELNPKLSEARAIIAESLGEQHRWGEMYEQYSIALQNTPNNPTVIQWFSEIQRNLGYTTLALETALRAYEMDPTSPVLNNIILTIASRAGLDDVALKHWKIAADLGVPDVANNNVAPLLIKRGEIDRMIEIFGWNEGDVPICIQARADPSLKPKILADYLANGTTRLGNRVTAVCLAYAGELDTAMDMLEAAVQDASWYTIALFWYPVEENRALRQTERFKQMVTKIGLVEFWRKNGWPDLCRPLSEEDFGCD
jgi:TolB-like protein